MEENIEKEELKEEVVSKDTYLRLLADFDNFKKRSVLEKEEIKKSTKVSTMDVIFSLVDEIKLAQLYEPHSGLEKILNKLRNSLEKEGFQEIDMTKYQEDLMEVISYGPGESGMIIGVVRTGYLYNGSICRFGQVILGNGN
jgi:molecular chaperone GrpE